MAYGELVGSNVHENMDFGRSSVGSGVERASTLPTSDGAVCRASCESIWQDLIAFYPLLSFGGSPFGDRGGKDGHRSSTKTSGHTTMTSNETHDGQNVARSPTLRRAAHVRQEQLIDIAIRLFAKKGYEGTSLRDIAEEARITKAALYYHFSNKEALYERIVVNSMQALLEDVRKAVASAADGEVKVRSFMLASAGFMDRSRDSWIASSNAFWSGSDAVSRASAIDLRDAYEGLLRSCIIDAISDGKFRKIDASMAGRMLLSMLNNISRWHSASGPATTYQVIEQYLDFAFSGLYER